MLKKSLKILILLILLYGLFSMVGCMLQDRLIFQSKSLPIDYAYSFPVDFEEHMIEVENNISLNALHFKSPFQHPKGIILYFHGNADNLSRWGNYAVDFTRHGFDILMLDYRGYGKSGGKPDEEVLYADAKILWLWLKDRYDYPKWILYGRSIGAAVASKLASETRPDLLIMETPFDELNGAGGVFLLPFSLHYEFNNKENLQLVKCPVVIFYGSRDLVVPPASTLRLKPYLKKGDKIILIDGAKHNNLRDFEFYHEQLEEVLDSFIVAHPSW